MSASPITLNTGWEIALQTHLSSISPQHQHTLSSVTTPEDIVSILERAQRNSSNRKVNKLLDAVNRATAPLRDFQTVADVLVQIDGRIGSVVWAPLKLVLLVLEKRGRGFDKLAEKLNHLVDALPRYNLYGQYFRDNTILQKALGNLFVSYIEFCFAAVRYWESNGLVNLLRSMSSSFDRQFLDIFASIDRHRNEVENTAAAVSLLYVQDVKHITTELKDTGIIQRESTSEWILQQPEYLRWTKNQDGDGALKFLWLRGGVGSGKTFLAHFIAKTLAGDHCNVVQYLFSTKQGQGIRRSNLLFVRTILYQLLINKNINTSSTFEALHSLRASSGKSEAQSPPKLWAGLFQLARGLANTPVYLIVDAIDEADQDEREDILDSLARLVSLAPSIRVLITGRPDEDIVAWVEKSSGISSLSQAISEFKIPDAAAARDIETYIDSRILRSSKLRHPAVAQQIKKDVTARAEGMFLYVRLMLDELEIESSVGAVRLRLGKFPRSLNDYYETVFRRISNNTDSTRELARNLLAWVTTSHEPMHVETVLVALQSQALSRIPSVAGPTKDDVDETRLLDPLKQIRSICFPLLEVTESGIAQLVHCSVAAYILNTGMNAHPEQDSTLLLTHTQASQEIALACIHFLRFGPEWSISDVTGDACSAFSDYSTKYWPEHLSESHQDDLVDIPSLFETMAPEQKWFVDWVARRSKLDYAFQKTFLLDRNGLPSCLEIAAYFNITSWAMAIIQSPSRHSTSSFPEMIAAARGSLDILRLFHQRASDSGSWNTQDKFLLHVAARNGHHAVVRYLIVETGWDANAIDLFGRSALMHACSHGHTAVINELLRQDVDVCVVSPAGYNAADGAAAIGDIQSLTALISRSHNGVTLNSLFLSSANGHANVVEYLLQHALLDLNGADKNSWTSLHWACRNGHRDVVKLLITYGATVDAHDSDGRTPLNRAVRIGDLEIVQMLLQAGASPVSRDSSGLSLTHFASAGGLTEVLSLLLQIGVDPNHGELSQQLRRNDAPNLTASGPPLHYAAEMGHTATVSYLLEHGADVDKTGPNYETALQKACDAGQESVVRILLDANANHESCGNSGKHRIPLAIAVRNLHVGIVSILAPIAWSAAATTAPKSFTFCEKSPINAAIQVAVERDNVTILASLFSYAPQNLHLPTCVTLNVFNKTFRDGNRAFAEFLVGLGFDLSKSTVQNKQYPTPLGCAAQGQNLPMVKFLLEGKVNPIEFSSLPDEENFEGHNREHLTALDAAVLARNVEILSLLTKRQTTAGPRRSQGRLAIPYQPWWTTEENA
ncbi:ankyrin repeat domain-containing protein 52 [Ilyonectria robusta]